MKNSSQRKAPARGIVPDSTPNTTSKSPTIEQTRMIAERKVGIVDS